MCCACHTIYNAVTDDAATVCDNNLPGVSNGEICCAASCGACGGADCKNLAGGRENCCMGNIQDSGVLCSVSEAAPCIMDDSE